MNFVEFYHIKSPLLAKKMNFAICIYSGHGWRLSNQAIDLVIIFAVVSAVLGIALLIWYNSVAHLEKQHVRSTELNTHDNALLVKNASAVCCDLTDKSELSGRQSCRGRQHKGEEL